MLERIQDVLKNRKQDDKGFSLVELAVVIVVIGILVAIAVPVFLGIQQSARDSAAQATLANASSTVAAHLAQGNTAAPTLTGMLTPEVTALTAAIGTGGGTVLDASNYCVTATFANVSTDVSTTSGPGC